MNLVDINILDNQSFQVLLENGYYYFSVELGLGEVFMYIEKAIW